MDVRTAPPTENSGDRESPTPVDPDATPGNALQLEPKENDGPSWLCPQCHEENPGNFNECWKRLKLREVAEDAK
jgi:hypothetical protein